MRRSLLLLLLFCTTAHAQLVDVFSEGESGYYCFKIPALIASQSGDLLAFAEARKFNCADHTWIDLVWTAREAHPAVNLRFLGDEAQ